MGFLGVVRRESLKLLDSIHSNSLSNQILSSINPVGLSIKLALTKLD